MLKLLALHIIIATRASLMNSRPRIVMRFNVTVKTFGQLLTAFV